MLWCIKEMSRTSTKSWQIKFFMRKGAFQILYIILITSHIVVKSLHDVYMKVLNSDLYLHEEFQRIIPLVLQRKNTAGEYATTPP